MFEEIWTMSKNVLLCEIYSAHFRASALREPAVLIFNVIILIVQLLFRFSRRNEKIRHTWSNVDDWKMANTYLCIIALKSVQSHPKRCPKSPQIYFSLLKTKPELYEYILGQKFLNGYVSDAPWSYGYSWYSFQWATPNSFRVSFFIENIYSR